VSPAAARPWTPSNLCRPMRRTGLFAPSSSRAPRCSWTPSKEGRARRRKREARRRRKRRRRRGPRPRRRRPRRRRKGGSARGGFRGRRQPLLLREEERRREEGASGSTLGELPFLGSRRRSKRGRRRRRRQRRKRAAAGLAALTLGEKRKCVSFLFLPSRSLCPHRAFPLLPLLLFFLHFVGLRVERRM